jgi:hypothetical protein
MIENHGPITSTNISHRFLEYTRRREQSLILDHRSHVGISLANMMLTSGKMTIDQANGGVVDYKTRHNPALTVAIKT